MLDECTKAMLHYTILWNEKRVLGARTESSAAGENGMRLKRWGKSIHVGSHQRE